MAVVGAPQAVVEVVVGGTELMASGSGSWVADLVVARLVAAFQLRSCRFVGDSCPMVVLSGGRRD